MGFDARAIMKSWGQHGNLNWIATFLLFLLKRKNKSGILLLSWRRVILLVLRWKTRGVRLTDEPFIGMWSSREDLQDSTAWVREVRQKEWGNHQWLSRSWYGYTDWCSPQHGNGSEMPGTIGANLRTCCQCDYGNGTSGWLPEQSGIEENRAVSEPFSDHSPDRTNMWFGSSPVEALSPQPRIADRLFSLDMCMIMHI